MWCLRITLVVHCIDGEVATHGVFFSSSGFCDGNARVVGIRLAPQLHKVKRHDSACWHILARNSDADNSRFKVLGLFRRRLYDTYSAAQRRRAPAVIPSLELGGKLLTAACVYANVNVVVVFLQQLVSDPAAAHAHDAWDAAWSTG